MAATSPATSPSEARTLDFLDAQAIPRRLRKIIRTGLQHALAEYVQLSAATAAPQEFANELRKLPGVGSSAARAVMHALRNQERVESFLGARERTASRASPSHLNPAIEGSADCSKFGMPNSERSPPDAHEDSMDEPERSPDEQRILLSQQLRQEVVRRRIAEAAFLQIQSSAA